LGISLYSSSNRIFDNHIWQNKVGVYLWSADNNIISNNDISENEQEGIYLCLSTDNLMGENHIFNNALEGIYLISKSDNNIVEGNNVSNNHDGICLYYSAGNIIVDNIVWDNVQGIWLVNSSRTTISANSFFKDGFFVHNSFCNTIVNNTVDNKPIIYLEGKSDEVVDYAGQVILIDCHNITVRNLEICDVAVGIELWNTSRCLISENSIWNNKWFGIWLQLSSNNTIKDNKISNSSDGIYLCYSKCNTIRENSIDSCRWCGIELYYDSDANVILKNEIRDCELGLWLIGSENMINQNNFVDDYIHASFDSEITGKGRHNLWVENYWGDWYGVGPKLIHGKMWVGRYLYLTWINFDWHPAKEPYNISL